MGTAEENNANAPTAFGLVVAAGMSTCIGAAIVFSKRLVKLASKRFLAGSLGIAAGVMLYVSLVEIFVKAQDSFAAHGSSDADAYLYATLSVFGGIIIYKGLDFLVHILEGDAGHHNVNIDLYDLNSSSFGGDRIPGNPTKTRKSDVNAAASEMVPSGAGGSAFGSGAVAQNTSRENPREQDVVVELTSGTTVQPSADLHTLHLRMAGKVQTQQEGKKSPVSALTPDNGTGPAAVKDEEAAVVEGENGHTSDDAAQVHDVDEKLVRMGLMTALAIGIHNFPEGLATFVASLSDPSVGAALAVAIAIHNIPEGLCVAIPVYYATGNRWKAFGWALLSGVSEPIGAGLGWLILKDMMSELVYGLLFGIVAGMMVNITIHELIPTAVRYDPADKVTTNSIIIGMVIMAASLTLFLY